MDGRSALHSLTWLVWALGATISLQLAPNPFYVALVVAIAAVVAETHRRDTVLGKAFGILLAVAVGFSLLRVALLVLTTHSSAGSVLATVPSFTLPRLLGGFQVGGELLWPVLWQALAEAFVVIGVMAVFGAFNSVASHHELLQSLPRAFHEPGVVLTVALAFVPCTIGSVAAVREADLARTGGRLVRRGRAVRLVVPVLESGLERAVQLADSMDARGFGRGRGAPLRSAAWLGVLGVVLGVGALAALVGEAPGLAAACGAAAGVALVAATLLAPRDDSRTRYRPRHLAGIDRAVIATSAAAPVLLGLCRAVDVGGLAWSATTLPLRAPTFHLVPALCLALLAVPTLVPRPADEAAAGSVATATGTAR